MTGLLQHGTGTSPGVEVMHIPSHGIRLLAGNVELFAPYEDFPRIQRQTLLSKVRWASFLFCCLHRIVHLVLRVAGCQAANIDLNLALKSNISAVTALHPTGFN